MLIDEYFYITSFFYFETIRILFYNVRVKPIFGYPITFGNMDMNRFVCFIAVETKI